METPEPLPPSALRWTIDPARLAGVRGREPLGAPCLIGHDRAMRALDAGLGIRERGFNVFVVGRPGSGRMTTIRHALGVRARREPRPDDWCMVHNFEEPDRPRAIRLDAGAAQAVCKDIDTALGRVLRGVAAAFEGEAYRATRARCERLHADRVEAPFARIERAATAHGFTVQRRSGGLTLFPTADGKSPMNEESFRGLPEAERARLEKGRAATQRVADSAGRRIRAIERQLELVLTQLDRTVVLNVAAPLLADLAKRHRSDALTDHLKQVIEDMVEHAAELRRPEDGTPASAPAAPEGARQAPGPRAPAEARDALLARYRVNVLVDNRRVKGAPVVEETHPTPANLLGRIDQRAAGRQAASDFTQVKAGALHRANGGYLLVDGIELLRQPAAWEGLKRALKNRAVEIEDVAAPSRRASVAALRPEPIPIEVKVVVVGTPELHDQLSQLDPDFGKLFKVKAEFDVDVERTPARVLRLAEFLAAFARREGLVPFDASGLAGMIEHAVRLASDRRRLTTRLGELSDLAREASFWARRRRRRRIAAGDVARMLEARRDRESAVEEQVRRAVRDGTIRIETRGAVIGQANALVVIGTGTYSFGAPARVTARVFTGQRGLVDIERQVHLGGPIHSKGVLILQGLLGDRFGRLRPLRFGATLCFEQSYVGLEGDSAGLAEALALISALGRVPLRQSFAVTGSIDQLGHVQAVGGINEKIEGFYETWHARPRRSPVGVVIPATSAVELALRDDVVRAAAAGSFRVYPVRTIEEAVLLVTGVPFGAADARGAYPVGTVGARCARAVEELNRAWMRGQGRTARR